MFLTWIAIIMMTNTRMEMRREMQRRKRMKMTRLKRVKMMMTKINQDGDENRRWFDPPSDKVR